MEKYSYVEWKVWETCGLANRTILEWTDDYTKALSAKIKAEVENKTIDIHYWIEQKTTILEPLK